MPIRDSRMLEFDEAAVRDALRQCGRQASMLGICADTIDSVAFAVDTQEVVISFHVDNVLSVQKLRAEQLVLGVLDSAVNV